MAKMSEVFSVNLEKCSAWAYQNRDAIGAEYAKAASNFALAHALLTLSVVLLQRKKE